MRILDVLVSETPGRRGRRKGCITMDGNNAGKNRVETDTHLPGSVMERLGPRKGRLS